VRDRLAIASSGGARPDPSGAAKALACGTRTLTSAVAAPADLSACLPSGLWLPAAALWFLYADVPAPYRFLLPPC